MSRRPRPVQSRLLSVLWHAGFRLVPRLLDDSLAPDPRRIRVTTPSVEVPFLPPDWGGVRLALLSDFHVGRFIRPPYVRRVVEMTNDLAPDLIALLGDYLVQEGALSQEVVDWFARLRAPLGKFAVLGNHDHWHGLQEVCGALERAGVVVLRNAHRLVTRGGTAPAPPAAEGRPADTGGGSGLVLAGVDDMWESTADVASALAGAPPEAPRILLCHNPDYAEHLPPQPRVDLMLSGHTHGGQIRLPLLTHLLASVHHRKYQQGLVQGPRCAVYVTRGVGVVGPPLRFRCPPGITILTLRAPGR
jgi:hypothetical protein